MTSKFTSRHAAASVVYNEKAHRDFVMGFRRRKQARREEARVQAAEQEKQMRREVRKQKRALMKETRERASGILNSNSDSDVGDIDHDAVIHKYPAEGGAVVTAVVAPLDVQSHKPLLNEPAPTRQEDSASVSATHVPGASDSPINKKLKLLSTVTKSRSRRRHISYTHTHHQKKRKDKSRSKRTTHSERRKQQKGNKQ